MPNNKIGRILRACLPDCVQPTRVATKDISGQIEHSGNQLRPAQCFSLKELKQATDNFNMENILDNDGSNFTVYKGILSNGKIVRVRRMQLGINKAGKSPLDQFQKELELLTGLHHRNIISLVGFCSEKNEHLMVYEHLPNATLSDHLHDNTKTPLPWETRMDIAICVAKGLAHLHGHTSPPIIHHNIKSTSILLNHRFVAKLAEFGLWKQVSEETYEATRSTVGYLPPEYFKMRKCTEKSDVFAFGVVMLELLTGERSFDRERHTHHDQALLVHMIPEVLRAGGGWEGVKSRLHPSIRNHPNQKQLNTFVNVALHCIEEDPSNRPDMESVVAILENLVTAE